MTKQSHNSFSRSFALTFAWFCFYSINASLSFGAAFEFSGIGARSLGMGSSFVAVPGSYESVFYNPSGIAKIEKKVFHTGYHNPYNLGLLRTITAGYLHPNIGRGVVAFSWTRLDATGDAGFLDYSENTIVFSYATLLFDPLFLALNGKYYRVTGALGASGMGLDFGATYVLKKPWPTLGISIQDLNRTVISWDSGDKDRLPLILRVGASSQILKQTLVSAQISWQDQKNRSHHLGLEQELFNRYFALRLGGVERNNLWRFSWGLGLKVKSFQIDYGWERQNLLGDTQVFSLSARF